MLQTHDETGAYSLGNLKHRNINGEVISSQEQYRSESESNMSGTDYDEDENEVQKEEDQVVGKQKSEKKLSILTKRGRSSQQVPKKKSPLLSTRPKSAVSGSSKVSRKRGTGVRSGSKRSTYDPQATLPESDPELCPDVEEGEDDDDAPLVHSLAPGKYDENRAPVRKKQKTNRSKSSGRSSSRVVLLQSARRFIDDEAEVASGFEDDADEHGNLSGFIVDSDESA
eukprot:IDg9498t1